MNLKYRETIQLYNSMYFQKHTNFFVLTHRPLGTPNLTVTIV